MSATATPVKSARRRGRATVAEKDRCIADLLTAVENARAGHPEKLHAWCRQTDVVYAAIADAWDAVTPNTPANNLALRRLDTAMAELRHRLLDRFPPERSAD